MNLGKSNSDIYLQGRVKFPTGGTARELFLRKRLIWLDSRADSKVWMEEDELLMGFLSMPIDGFRIYWTPDIYQGSILFFLNKNLF